MKSRDVCSLTLPARSRPSIYTLTPPCVDDPFFLKGVDGDIGAAGSKRHDRSRATRDGQR
jgi:hypothetical protein